MKRVARTLLIVDDSPEDRELYRRHLTRHNLRLEGDSQEYSYTILEAELGQAGLDLWQQHQPDAVLVDYRLPDMDGLEFLRELKSRTLEHCLPVILMTGQGNEAITVQAMKAGAQDYLIKGQITPEGLYLAIKATIETVQLRTQLQQRIERERLISQIIQKIQQMLDLKEILQTIVDEVRQFLHTDRVLFFRLESDGNGTVVAESVGAEWRSLHDFKIYDPCLAKSYLRFSRPDSVNHDHAFVDDYFKRYRQGQVTAITDIQNSDIERCHIDLLTQFQVRANLVVPILHGNQFWGLLIAHHCTAPRSWQPLEIDLLQSLASPVSIALRQVELYQQAQRELAERQQTEVELRKSEERLRVALEASRMGWWDWNIQTGNISWSQNLEALFGMEPGQFDGSFEMFANRLHPDDRERVLAAIDHAVTTGADYVIEFRIVYPNGTIRWALTQGKVLYDPNGCPIRMAGIDIDITDRKQAEEAMMRSEERYRTLFESMEDGFCVIKLLFDENNIAIDYRFLETNPAFEQQTGLQQAEGKTARQLLPNLEAYWFEMYGKVALTGEPIRFENGSDVMSRWFDVYAFRIEEPESRKVAILFKDISHQKAITQQREQLLQQEQTARAEAERANRVKDEFLAVLSHELRSPLNPILGWTKLLQTRKFDQTKITEALATIERNAKLQTQLIDDLLDVAKILRGKLSMDNAPVDLVFVIESAIDTVRTAAVAKSIVLHPALAQIGWVSGDSTRLQQVVWNLLSNAIKFTPPGGEVTIWLERVDHQAQITVSDTGKGINPDFLPHLFESFRQEDTSTTRQFGGLGLGLAIVRSLVEAHGGVISADSPGEGQGATFIVRFPLLEVAPESQQPDDAPTQNLDLKGIRVLAADDEPDARDLLAMLLTLYGAEAILIVASATEVLANLESFQPDILISDIGMPEMDGYTLIQQIRALPPEKGGQIPAIALTAYAREEDYQRAIDSGYQQHVTKPLDPEQLVRVLVTLASQPSLAPVE